MATKKLSLEEKIGQRFIIGVNDSDILPIIDLIEKCHIGGVILYKKNYNSYSDMLKVIESLKEANKNNKIPLFIAIDQEGGIVNRMPPEVNNLRNIYDVSKHDKKLVPKYADIIGNILASSGINMNLAPSLDIYNGSKSKVVFKRCFYGNDEEVGALGKKYILEMNNHNIISVAKHFPGHGASKVDSHFIIPYIHNYKDMLVTQVNPFKMVLNDVPAIMLGHLVVRKLTNLLPVTMSNKFIINYIRCQCNYDGIVMTDEINMLRRHLLYRFNYVNKILKSDNDIILVKIRNYKEGYKIINKYKNMLSKNKELKENLDKHVDRILSVKNKYNITDKINYKGIQIDKINKEIDLLNKKI